MPELRIVPLGDIQVGDRHRKDMGDIAELARSMALPAGLLQPIGLNRTMGLIFGARRLAAARQLGWESIPAYVFETLDNALAALRAERDENICRKEFTPSELGAVASALLAMERSKAKDRQKAAGGDHGNQHTGGKKPGGCPGKFPGPPPGDQQPQEERARDAVGEALGVSGKTAEKAAAVHDAAQKDPQQFGDLPAKADAESIDAAHKELKRRRNPKPPTTERPKADTPTVVEPPKVEIPPQPPPPLAPEPPEEDDVLGGKTPTHDALGIRLEGDSAKAFEASPLFKQARSHARKLARILATLGRHPGGDYLRNYLEPHEIAGRETYKHRGLEQLVSQLKSQAPHAAACPWCMGQKGVRADAECQVCRGRPFVPVTAYGRNLPPEYLFAVQRLLDPDTIPPGEANEEGL